MKRLLTLTLLTTLTASAQTSITRLDGSHLSAADAQSFAAKTLAANHVTGAQLAVLNHGHLVWSASFGLAGKSPDRPFDAATTTWAASITKSLFATYVMQLVERHQFDLDKPVAQQLPQPLDTYPPYRTSASDLVHDPLWQRVTPRMLLSHSSGLRNFASMEPDNKLHLHFPPGSQFMYSGDGINLVQFLVEQQQHQPLDVLMQQALFAPLHMDRTGLIFRPAFSPDVADRFDLNEKFLSQTRRDNPRGAGSMSTSAEDLARFLTALFADKILTPQTRAAMLKPVLPIHTLHQFPNIPNGPLGKEGDAVGLAYGTGWGLLTHTKFGPAFFKEGHGDGAQDYVICFQRSQSCMILLTNSDNGELAFRALLEHILGDTVTPWEWEGYTPAYIAAARQNP
ncbi:MAG: serine hydrolase domain-containing protein [Acidobacteriota bacterium]